MDYSSVAKQVTDYIKSESIRVVTLLLCSSYIFQDTDRCSSLKYVLTIL